MLHCCRHAGMAPAVTEGVGGDVQDAHYLAEMGVRLPQSQKHNGVWHSVKSVRQE